MSYDNASIEELANALETEKALRDNTLREISEIERKLKKKQEEVDPIGTVAILLHSITCKHNHTDGCSWFYEIVNGVHDWSRSEHAAQRHRAMLLLSSSVKKGVDADTVITVLKELQK